MIRNVTYITKSYTTGIKHQSSMQSIVGRSRDISFNKILSMALNIIFNVMLERHTFYVVEYPISQSYISWKNNCSNSNWNFHSFENNNVDIFIPKILVFRKQNNHIHYKKSIILIAAQTLCSDTRQNFYWYYADAWLTFNKSITKLFVHAREFYYHLNYSLQ